jgi:5-methylcytosine-specific restriction endonuclease McrA
LIEQQRGLCYLTGRPLLQTDCSVDHVIPLSKGGTHDFDNLKLCVKNANYLKADLTIDEMVPLCQRVVDTLGNPIVKPRRDLAAEIQDLIENGVEL